MDDVQAVRRLKYGDMNGLEYLVERYQVKAVRAAFLITRDEQTAEDVVQETFIRIFQRINHFDDSRPFEPYLMRSVANAAINAAGKNRSEFELDEDGAVKSLGDMLFHAGLVEDEVEYRQLIRDIFIALEKLSSRQRAVIVQRYYMQMSEKEMAEALSASPGTVKWLLNAARQRLKRLLTAERSAK